MKYRIESPAGVDFGVYEADTEQEALDKLAQDAGYRDQEHATEVADEFGLRSKPIVTVEPEA